MNLKPLLRRGLRLLPERGLASLHEKSLLLQANAILRLLPDRITSLREVEFSVFSQWGDDGIIQFLLREIRPATAFFVEFGVSDYVESNTRFLLINNNWAGLVLDSDPENVARIKAAPYFWRHELQARQVFVTAENIGDVLRSSGVPRRPGLLHIDIDGNDYWIWKALHDFVPDIAILEYNAVLGAQRAITVPYRPDFVRQQAHPSFLYYGASLGALIELGRCKGYRFVGCNSAGNNAYFVHGDAMTPALDELASSARFVESRFRESRDARGELDYLQGAARYQRIRGLPVVNTTTGELEAL